MSGAHALGLSLPERRGDACQVMHSYTPLQDHQVRGVIKAKGGWKKWRRRWKRRIKRQRLEMGVGILKAVPLEMGSQLVDVAA